MPKALSGSTPLTLRALLRRFLLLVALTLPSAPAARALDLETAARLELELPSTTPEDVGAGLAEGRVYRINTSLDTPVVVSLTPQSPITLTPTVTIPAGMAWVSFPVAGDVDLGKVTRLIQVPVTASAAGFLAASANLRIDGRPSTGLSLVLPPHVLAGEEGVGLLRVDAPLDHDVQFTLRWWAPWANPPFSVTLTRGSGSVPFPVRRDVAQSNPAVSQFFVTAESDDFQPVSGTSVLEGPARPLAGFELAWAESAIWSGEDTPLLVRVLSTNNPPLHLAAAPTLAAASSTTPLDLQVTAPFEWSETDRGWKGKVRATGESLDGLVRVAAGAYSQSLPLPPVVVGRTTEVPILDADWCPRLGQLLTLQGPPIHPLGSLVTLDPDSGLETARLLLPTPATSLSLTPDGGAAWLLSTRRSVLRADATSWGVSGEVPLPPSLDPNAVPAALCALGGTPERVVVGLLATNPTPKLKLLLLLGDQFTGSPLEIPSPLGGPVRLLATEQADEVLVVLPDLAYVVTSQAGQLAITHTSPAYVLFPRDSMQVARLGDSLWRSSGLVQKTTDLTRRTNTVLGGLLVARPLQGAMFSLSNSILSVVSAQTPQFAFSHPLPSPVNAYGWSRLIACSPYTFAGMGVGDIPGTWNLTFFRSLLAPDTRSHVRLQVEDYTPIVLSLTTPLPTQPAFHQTLRLLNEGPGPIPALGIFGSWAVNARHGWLNPGDSWRIPIDSAYWDIIPGTLINPLTLFTAVGDSGPDAAPLLTTQEARYEPVPGWMPVPGGVARIVGSRLGSTLLTLDYRQVPLPGGSSYELQSRDPSTGDVLHRYAGTNTYFPIAVSEDGAFAFASIARGEVERWNADDPTQGLRWKAGSTPVLDLLPIPGQPHAVVVVSTDRVTVFDDDQPRTRTITGKNFSVTTARVTAGSLWIAEAAQLSDYLITPEGLQPGPHRHAVLLGSQALIRTWNLDAKSAYFPSVTQGPPVVVDLNSGQATRPDLASALWLPGPEEGLLLGANSGWAILYNTPALAELGRLRCDPLGYDAVEATLFQTNRVAVRLVNNQARVLDNLFLHNQGSADLAIRLEPVDGSSFIPDPHRTLTLTVTNRSDVVSPGVQVVVTNTPGLPQVAGNYFLGDLPAHASRVLTFPTTLTNEYVCVGAMVTGPLADPVPGNNQAVACYNTRLFVDPNLLSLRLSTNLILNTTSRTFQIEAVIENHDVIPWSPAILNLRPSEGVEITGVSEGGIAGAPEFAAFPIQVQQLAPIQPGGSRRLTLTARTLVPGWTDFHVALLSIDTDHRVVCYTPADPLLDPPGSARLIQADHAVQEPITHSLILSFSGTPSWLMEVDPESLAPTWITSLAAPIGPIVAAGIKNQAWVAVRPQRLALMDITSGKQLRSITVPDPDSLMDIQDFALLPGTTNTLITLLSYPAQESTPVLAAIVNGVVRTPRMTGIASGSPDARVFFSAPNRVLYGDHQTLLQYAFPFTGDTPVREFTPLVPPAAQAVGVSSNTVVLQDATLIDLKTGTVSSLATNAHHASLDTASAQVCTAVDTPLHDGNVAYEMDCLSLADRRVTWGTPLPEPANVPGFWDRFMPFAGRGVLFLHINHSYWLPQPTGSSPTVDVTMHPAPPTDLLMSNAPVHLAVELFNTTSWPVHQGAVTVTLDDGLAFAGSPPGTLSRSFPLPDFVLTGRIEFDLTASTLNSHLLTLVFTNTTPLAEGSQGHTQQLPLTLRGPLTLLLADRSLREADTAIPGVLPAILSAPAPTDLFVVFSVAPINAQPPAGFPYQWSARFPQGSTRSDTPFPLVNDTIEPDREYLFTLQSAPIPASQDHFTLKVLDDDLPTLTATVPLLVPEGAPPGPARELVLTLSSPLPVVAEVGYQFGPEPFYRPAATPGRDFATVSGRVVFPPGTVSAVVSIPVVDDTEYEPTEVMAVTFVDPVNLAIPHPVTSIWIQDDDPPAPPTLRIGPTAEGEVRWLTLGAEGGARYQIEQRASIVGAEWEPIGVPVQEHSGAWKQELVIPVPAPGQGARFYRARVVP